MIPSEARSLTTCATTAARPISGREERGGKEKGRGGKKRNEAKRRGRGGKKRNEAKRRGRGGKRERGKKEQHPFSTKFCLSGRPVSPRPAYPKALP
jgi:hypothetical protein